MSGSSWKVAYADFVTALMAFFLLMWIVSMAPEKTKAVLAEYFTPAYWDNAFSGGTGKQAGNISGMSGKNREVMQDSPTVDNVYYSITRKLNEEAKAMNLSPSSQGPVAQPDGVLFNINSELLFKPNSAEISTEGREVFNRLAAILKEYNVAVIVRGHTDPTEEGNNLYPGKWALSSARATATVHYLVSEQGISPNLLTAVGYADTKPLVPNSSAEGRAQNRRVEFKIQRPETLTGGGGY